jgi:hypothetical protein
MASLVKCNLSKRQVGKNKSCMKWQIHRMASWHSDKLAEIAIAKMQVYKSGKITKQQIEKMAS